MPTIQVPPGAEIISDITCTFTYIDHEGEFATEVKLFPCDPTTEAIAAWRDDFIFNSLAPEKCTLTIQYPHCHLPVHLLYERGLLEF
jgi:hypothetical protein